MNAQSKTFSFYWELPNGQISCRFDSKESAFRSAKRLGLVFYKIVRHTTIELVDEVYCSYDTF